MNPKIEIDEATYRSIELAARLTGVSVGGVVARLVAQTIESSGPSAQSETETDGAAERGTVPIFADYDGHRTHGQFDAVTHRIDITSGPLTGRQYKTPSKAAVAVVSHHKPGVNPNRNGWTFWSLDDGSGRRLQSIRSG